MKIRGVNGKLASVPKIMNSSRVYKISVKYNLSKLNTKLYGIIPDELRCILDPKDVYGPDFPGETFRVLKEKEEREYGEYRTRRLIIEAWDKLERDVS